MEKKTEVKTIQVHYECPECKGSYMEFTGRTQLTSPPQYVYYVRGLCVRAGFETPNFNLSTDDK